MMNRLAKDNMNTYHYPVANRSRYHQATSYKPFYSVLHSKAFTELELSKPSQLINESSHDSSMAALELPENPFTSYASFSMYESRVSTPPLKENPFLTATPFRFSQKQIEKESGKGLSAWEKQKYLQMYADRQREEEINGHAEAQFQRHDTPQEGNQRIIRSKKEMMSKGPKIEQLPFEQQPKTATFKKRNTLVLEQESQNSYRKASPLDLKSKFSELENELQQDARAWNYQKDEFNHLNKEVSHQDKQQNSLIHKLMKAEQIKPLKMANSRVLEYQYGSNKISYPTSEIQERSKLERKVEQASSSRNDDTFNFNEKEGNQEAKKEGTYINKIREFPPSITYKYTKYELVKIV